MSDGFTMKVDFDKDTIAQEGAEKRFVKDATVQIMISKAVDKPCNDPRREGAKAPGVTFTISVLHPDTGKVVKEKRIISWCGLPLKSPDTPDLQPRDFVKGSGSTWHGICAGFVDDFYPILWDNNKAYVNGQEMDRAEIKGYKAKLGDMRVRLAKDHYLDGFKSLLENNVAYAEIAHEGDWDKVKNIRKELAAGEELTPYEELFTYDAGDDAKAVPATGGAKKKKKAPAPKKKKKR